MEPCFADILHSSPSFKVIFLEIPFFLCTGKNPILRNLKELQRRGPCISRGIYNIPVHFFFNFHDLITFYRDNLLYPFSVLLLSMDLYSYFFKKIFRVTLCTIFFSNGFCLKFIFLFAFCRKWLFGLTFWISFFLGNFNFKFRFFSGPSFSSFRWPFMIKDG